METSITKRVKNAREIMAEFKDLEKINFTLYWRRAEAVYKLKKNNLWKYAYGDDGGTWVSFCFNELKTPRSTADEKAAAYEFFVVKHGFTFKQLSNFDAHALYYISCYKADSTKSEIETYMQKSEHMTRQDLMNELRGKECEHKEVDDVEEHKQVCKTCKKVVLKLKNKKKK